MNRPARRTDGMILPMPDRSQPMDYEQEFTIPQFEQLAQGVIPQSMDERWFI